MHTYMYWWYCDHIHIHTDRHIASQPGGVRENNDAVYTCGESVYEAVIVSEGSFDVHVHTERPTYIQLSFPPLHCTIATDDELCTDYTTTLLTHTHTGRLLSSHLTLPFPSWLGIHIFVAVWGRHTSSCTASWALHARIPQPYSMAWREKLVC